MNTPSFDDSVRSEMDVLQELAGWLAVILLHGYYTHWNNLSSPHIGHSVRLKRSKRLAYVKKSLLIQKS